ncbi:MAG: MmgE/PrpD family protein [Firmicutes bacterium]|nr:MmgE/PrpD family protein [Bacillota bacterium]
MAEGEAAEAARDLEALARWAAAVRPEQVPPAVRAAAALVVADDWAAMVAGGGEPEVQAVWRTLAAAAGAGESTVWAAGAPRADRFTAAQVNAVAGCWLELDEGYRLATCHAGLYTVPAALAEAEATGAGLEECVTAVAVAYEVAARVARAWTLPPLRLHPHGLLSPLGAAVASGHLLGLDGDAMVGAVTAALASGIASPYSHAVGGALVRNAWAGWGARIGMQAAHFAPAGVAGLAGAADDVLTHILAGRPDPAQLTQELGEAWAVSDGYHKVYACCQYAHSAVEAALEVRARLGDGAGSTEIDAVEVQTHPLGLSLTEVEPKTTLAAKFSLPHAVAAALVLGSGGREAFTHEAIDDPRVARLRRRVALRPIEGPLVWPHDRPARVAVRLGDGRVLEADCPSALGGPDRPLDEEAVWAKVRSLTADAFPSAADQLRRALAAVTAGETEGRRPVRELAAALAAAGRTAEEDA